MTRAQRAESVQERGPLAEPFFPSIFDCFWRYSWMYWLAQLTGAGLAALLAVFIYGRGPFLLDEEQRNTYFASYMGMPVSSGQERDTFTGGREYRQQLLSPEERAAAAGSPQGAPMMGGGGVV